MIEFTEAQQNRLQNAARNVQQLQAALQAANARLSDVLGLLREFHGVDDETPVADDLSGFIDDDD